MANRRHILRVAIATETRAEYWLLRPVYRALANQPGVQPTFLASGMHHLARFGRTIDAIRADNVRVREIVTIEERGLSPFSRQFSKKGTVPLVERGRRRQGGQSPFPKKNSEMGTVPCDPIARAVGGYARELEDFDWLIVLGDRLEMLAACVAATALGKPIGHIHGGDVAPGARDDAIRHAITKLAHLHFPATADAARRIRRLGEQAWRIHRAGAPAIDAARQTALPDKAELDELVGFDTAEPFAVVLQHAAGFTPKQEQAFLLRTLAAVADHFARAVVIGPGLDAGSGLLHETIKKFVSRRRPRDSSPWAFFPTLDQRQYFGLLRHAAVLVGNSSSGMIESGCFRLPVVNVGPRQKGRLHSCNVIDCDYGREAVTQAIQEALVGRSFRARLRQCRNLYGAGRAGATIARVLAGTPIDRRLLVKETAY